jgi:hypothetical protein
MEISEIIVEFILTYSINGVDYSKFLENSWV